MTITHGHSVILTTLLTFPVPRCARPPLPVYHLSLTSRFSSFCLLLILSALTCFAADTTTLWQIGTPDRNNTEFALAPKRRAARPTLVAQHAPIHGT